MTVQTTDTQVIYSGDGVSVNYAFNFVTLDVDHIFVFLDSNPSIIAFTTTLNVDQAANPGGFVLFEDSPPPVTKIKIARIVPQTQLTDYTSYDAFPAESHERALDKLTMISQQVEASIDAKVVRAPVSDPISIDMVLPDAAIRANLFMAFDANGEPTSTAGIGDEFLRDQLASMAIDDGTEGFNLVHFPPAPGEVGVVNLQFKIGHILRYGTNLVPGTTDMSAAFQAAITSAEVTNGEVTLGSETYYCPTASKTSEETIQFTTGITASLTIKGEGKGSILKGTGAAAAVYINGVNDGTTAILRIHKSNVIIENIQFRESPVGLYLGHDPDNASRGSHVSICRIENLWFQDCGTCILLQPGKTLYYNNYNSIQFQNFQIAIHHGLPYLASGTGLDVSNRNNYSNISMNNGWVGFMVENGDTCTLDCINFESINGLGNAVGSIPSQIHDANPVATAIHVNDSAHPFGINDWKITNCHAEACTRDLYLDGDGWGFVNVWFELSKIVVSPLAGASPIYLSNGSTYQSGAASGYHLGDLHIKQSIGIKDPFIPSAGINPDDRGVYIDGGRISDTGGRLYDSNVSRTAGSHSGSANTTILVDANKSWLENEWVDATITNTTDGSTGTITESSSNTATALLSGGTDNSWNLNDNYTVIKNDHILSVEDGTTKHWKLGNIREWFCHVEFTRDPSLGNDDPLRLKLPGLVQIDPIFDNIKMPAFAQSLTAPRSEVELTFVPLNARVDIEAPVGSWSDTNNKVIFTIRWFDIDA